MVEPEGVEVDVDAVVVVRAPAVGRHVHAAAEELHHRARGGESHVAVLLVAERVQGRRHAPGLATQTDEVDVAHRPAREAAVGARGKHGQAADQAQHDASGGGGADDLPRLGEHLVGHGGELWLRSDHVATSVPPREPGLVAAAWGDAKDSLLRARKSGGGDMAGARFLVVVPHESDHCLDAVEATINQGPGFQEAYEWGASSAITRDMSSCAPAAPGRPSTTTCRRSCAPGPRPTV